MSSLSPTYKSLVINQIEQILQHLETHLTLANVHMVDFFTKNVFSKYIPPNIQAEVKSHGFTNTIELIYNQQTEGLPHLHSYIHTNRNLTLKNTSVCMSFDELKKKLQELGCEEIPNLRLDIFMKRKKSHEVEVLGELAAKLQNLSHTSHLIDIGDGKGYLSSLLALHYKLSVLGIDASQINTDGAVQRANKLSRVWNGAVTHIKTKETSLNLYKQITKFVDENVDFNSLISNVFLQEPQGIGVVGLHTCGNLASTCLNIFNTCENVKTICNVGCCYHHLTEEFHHDKNGFYKEQIGFPLSRFLREKKYVVERGARMLAAQSVERILSKQERPSKAMFYRALFEIIITQSPRAQSLKEKQVGRFRRESPSFLDYVKKASKRIDFPLEMSDKDISALYFKFQHRSDELDLFYLIRAMLAPVVETLILLDRLLFLLENGHENSYLVQLFDPVVSPRCYGIVSIKK